MSDENKYNISDIINFASQQNPLEVKNAVDALMIDKIHAAIADKKIEVAKQMFGGEEPEEQDEVEFDEDEAEQQEDGSEEDVEDSDDDDFMDISDDELEELLNDLENLDLDADLEDDNLDSEENDNGENA